MLNKIAEYYGVSRKGAGVIVGFVAVVAAVAGLAASPDIMTKPAPSLVGKNLADVSVADYQDVLGNRSVWKRENWKVCSQSPSPGIRIGIFQGVSVGISKIGESCTKKVAVAKEPTKSESQRICEDIENYSLYQVVRMYNRFMKDSGDPNAIANTLYGVVMLSCEDKMYDERYGIYDFIYAWAPEIWAK